MEGEVWCATQRERERDSRRGSGARRGKARWGRGKRRWRVASGTPTHAGGPPPCISSTTHTSSFCTLLLKSDSPLSPGKSDSSLPWEMGQSPPLGAPLFPRRTQRPPHTRRCVAAGQDNTTTAAAAAAAAAAKPRISTALRGGRGKKSVARYGAVLLTRSSVVGGKRGGGECEERSLALLLGVGGDVSGSGRLVPQWVAGPHPLSDLNSTACQRERGEVKVAAQGRGAV